jgi:hypothetical protein
METILKIWFAIPVILWLVAIGYGAWLSWKGEPF